MSGNAFLWIGTQAGRSLAASPRSFGWPSARSVLLMSRLCWLLPLLLGLAPADVMGQTTPASSQATSGPQANVWAPPPDWLLYSVLTIVFLAGLLALVYIKGALANAQPPWALADALSEEVELPVITKTGEIQIDDATKKAVTAPQMSASSSRLIALMGMIVILLMFMGFGIFALHSFAKSGQLPKSMDDARDYLLAGMTLFAPYIINKFSDIFTGIGGKKT